MNFNFTMQQVLSKGHRGIHAIYFGAVGIEGHGYYAICGAILCVLAILNVFLHFEGE